MDNEEYRSSTNMNLLIPCSIIPLDVDEVREFGNILGELQVNSSRFREQTSLFCLAYHAKNAYRWRIGHDTCRRVLERAKKYTTLFDYSNEFGGGQMKEAM